MILVSYEFCLVYIANLCMVICTLLSSKQSFCRQIYSHDEKGGAVRYASDEGQQQSTR